MPVTQATDSPHPLLSVLLAAADGSFPPVDGRVRFVPPPRAGLQAVVSFTGHAIIATDLPRHGFATFALDGYGAALAPQVLQHLAGPGGEVGCIDVVLVARGLAGGDIPLRTDLDDHPRVRRARRLRQHVRVYGDERGLVTLGAGLAGRTELSVECPDGRQGQGGAGRSLIRNSLGLVARDQPVFAAVSPGNARSLRAFLAVGFVPLGSEVLISRG